MLTHLSPQHLIHSDTGNPLGWVASDSRSLSLLQGERRVHPEGWGLEASTAATATILSTTHTTLGLSFWPLRASLNS